MKKQEIVLGVVAAMMAMHTATVVAAPAPPPPMEKCYGIVKAGKNDCGTPTNACAAQVKQNNDPNAWIFVPKGTCDKIVGGSVKSAEKK